MIYFNNSQACVIYLKEKNSAYIAVEGFIETDTVKGLMIKTLELCSKMNVKSILLDASKLEVLRNEDINWIIEITYPGFKKLPLMSIAYVKPQNVFGDRSIKKLIRQNSSKEFKEFTNLEDAEKWTYLNQKKIIVNYV